MNNLKPFDLAAAKAGAPVVTRCKSTYIFGAHNKDATRTCKIIGWIGGTMYGHNEFGKWLGTGEEQSARDLFMAPVQKEGWINIYSNVVHLSTIANIYGPYETEELAHRFADKDRVDCIKITWEE